MDRLGEVEGGLRRALDVGRATGGEEQDHRDLRTLVDGEPPALDEARHDVAVQRDVLATGLERVHHRGALRTADQVEHLLAREPTALLGPEARDDAQGADAEIAEVLVLQRTRGRMHDEAGDPRAVVDAAHGAFAVGERFAAEDQASKLFVADAPELLHRREQHRARRRS